MPIIYKCDRCGKESKTYNRHCSDDLVLCDKCTKKYEFGRKAFHINQADRYKKFKEDFLNKK